METLPTTPDEDLDALEGQETDHNPTKKGFLFTAEQREAGRQLRLEKIAHWETLDTRQDFVDERFMRGILKAAKVRAPLAVEPATAGRLRTMLRRTGMQQVDIVEAVGTGLDAFLQRNPKLPLWAALSAILESTGKYDATAQLFVEQDEESVVD